MTASLPRNFWRHEYSRLVASLTRRFGEHLLSEVEDAVQSALTIALERWCRSGTPKDPSAWLYRVASNRLRDALRAHQGHQRILSRHPDALAPTPSATEVAFEAEVRDDLLRMLFVCCDERVPGDSQLALALKTLCGFSVPEIAERLFSTEASVYKRLSRARDKLREQGMPPQESSCYASRLPRVHKVLYLLFTEGHLSSHTDIAVRRELCDEALRLATLLAEHPIGDTPTTAALVALFCLQSARLPGRMGASRELVLLEEQDRSRWDSARLELGMRWLARSAAGDSLSRYHLEASIAAKHGLAPSLEETNWEGIARDYALLERVAPSPLHRLGRALAVAQARGARAGLHVLEEEAPPAWLVGSHLWLATRADLHLRAGDQEEGSHYRSLALMAAPSVAVRDALERRLSSKV